MQCSVRELTSDEYALWDKLVAISPQRSIFSQRWWMDIVTRGGVRLLGCFENDRLQAGMPIWPCTTLGVKRLRQPPLTPFWGPILHPLEGKYATRLSAETDILRAFAQALAPWPDINFTMHPSLNNWLPFYWHSFNQMTRYTYRIDNLEENLPTAKSLHRSIRNALNRAESHGLTIREMVDPIVIADLSRMSMERQDLESSAEIRAFWPELARAAEERNCILNTVAVDPEGIIHAGYAIVWDDCYAYDLYGGGNPHYRESGGGTLALKHLIERAAAYVPAFDFEGSMLESIGRFFRQFGGELTPYFSVSRAASKRLNCARALMRWRDAHRQRSSQQSPGAERESQIPSTT